MTSQRRSILSSRTCRALVAAVVLLSYLAAVIGYPVSVSPRSQANGSPSTCCARNCGCSASEQLHGCCCCVKPVATAAEPKCSRCLDTTIKWVAGVSARECRGEETVWLSLAGAAPPPPAFTWSLDAPVTGSLPILTVVPTALMFSPPTPPPRG